MQHPDHLTVRYREAGRRLTPQRQAIFRALHENTGHPTAEAVHAAVIADLPNVSLRTVYSILGELAEMGEVLQLELGTGSFRFDPNMTPHHHAVCDRCGTVRDVFVDHPDVRPAGAQCDGFRITGTEIVFRGTCAQCAPATGD
mgnify:CR=1 FL=1